MAALLQPKLRLPGLSVESFLVDTKEAMEVPMTEAALSTAIAPSSAPPTRTRLIIRRILIALAVMLTALFLLVGVTIGPLLLEPNPYKGVPSIEARTDYRDPNLMRQAWALPVASTYQRGGFEYQSNPSFCGPASVANLLRSLGRRTDQDKVIDETPFEPWFGILPGGLTLDELAELASLRLGSRPGIVRDPSLAEFRAWLKRSNDPSYRIIVNFHRGPLFGRGHGHFSPVLGYLEGKDLVLVGDVNESYRPFLVSSERLWRAADTVDRETGKERGLIVARVGT